MAMKALSFNFMSSCSPCSSLFAQGCNAPTRRVLTFHAQRLAKLANKHECFLDKVTYCIGVLSFGLFCYLLGSNPQVIPYFYCLLYTSIVPLRWMYYRSKKWHYYLLDFCYFANAIFVSMLLFFPTNSRLFMLCFSFSEGPLAWALIVWRCSLVFSSIDKIISVLIHLLPGTVFFILRWWDKNTLFLADVTEDGPFHRWPVVKSIPTLWMWLFMAPLMVYCIWQGLYFLVVEGLRRQRILQDPEVMTSYKELKRKAERANNIWWHLSGLLGDKNRVYMYAVIQGAFTIATLAFTVPIFKSYHLHICFEVFKVAAIVWNGGRYVFEVMPRQAAKKLSDYKDVQMAVKKLSSSTKDVSKLPNIGRADADGAREKIFSTENTEGLEVCHLCRRRVSSDNRDHLQSECRDMNSNADAVQLLRLMLEQPNNREKQNVRCDSLDQRGFKWNRQVACAS